MNIMDTQRCQVDVMQLIVLRSFFRKQTGFGMEVGNMRHRGQMQDNGTIGTIFGPAESSRVGISIVQTCSDLRVLLTADADHPNPNDNAMNVKTPLHKLRG